MLRNDLNDGNLNQIADEFRQIKMGELVSLLISKLGFTETDVVPSANVATLANQPSAIFQVNAGTATVTGVKKLLKGPITGPRAIVPATGECVWDGGLHVLCAAVDAVTKVSFVYAQATDKASILLRAVDELH